GGFAPAERAALAELGPCAQGAAGGRNPEVRHPGPENTPAGPGSDPRATEGLPPPLPPRRPGGGSFPLASPPAGASLRVTATAPVGPAISWGSEGPGGNRPPSPSREVDFDAHGGVTEAPVIGRADLAGPGWVSGPCVIEEPAATTLVLPGQAVR